MLEVFGFSRREVLKTTVAVSAAAMLASLGGNFAHAGGSGKIRVGLVGCGGRGMGAANDIVEAGGSDVVITALGDVFKDRLDHAREKFSQSLKDNIELADDRCFVGFDAYEKVIASEIDLVILATPPGFRPAHIKAAADAGKHIFAEKPVAVDAVGARSVMESARVIKEKNLGFVAGTQRRHQADYLEAMKRVHDGAIGELVSAQCYWNQGYLWMHPRKAEWSDMEWQLRNWLYFTWLSGDHIVEQHVHQMDVMNWAFGGPPVKAYGMGGRQVRTDPAYGHIYDHFAVEYEYKNGARIMSMCRQIDGCDNRVAERVVGTKGVFKSDPVCGITGANPFRFDKSESKAMGPYQQEHKDLLDSIKAGTPLNEAQQIAETTLTAIMGRMSTYSGKAVTWEQAMKSEEDLMPKTLEMGPMQLPPVAMPGKAQVT